MADEEFIEVLEVAFRRAIYKLGQEQSIHDLLPLLRAEISCELWENWLVRRGYPV